jgi:hypothetical protein
LVDIVDPPLKKQKIGSHITEASGSVPNVKETADEVVVDEEAAKGSVAPTDARDATIKARKKVTVGGGQTNPKGVAEATRVSLTHASVIEVVDGDDRTTSFMIATSFPFASIGAMTLVCQLGEVIQVCPSSSPRGSGWYKVAIRGSPY